MHPWRRLRALVHIELEWHDGGDPGVTDHDKGTISIRRGMTQAQRRCTVLHECLHVERGPVPMGLAEREELRVWKQTSRELLPDLGALADALAWAGDDAAAAADELWVCEDTLRVRLKYLHPAERGWLKQRLEDGDRCE